MGVFEKNQNIVFFSENTQNCFAHNSATKYRLGTTFILVEKYLLLVYRLSKNSKNLMFILVRRHKTLNDTIYIFTGGRTGMRKDADLQTPSVEIFQNCGNVKAKS